MGIVIDLVVWAGVQVGIFLVATLASPATPTPKHAGVEINPPAIVEQIEIERAPVDNNGS